MQPAADGAVDPDRGGLAPQQEEGGLEGVVGVVGVVEHASADAQDHRPVPADQGLEGQLVAVGDVSFQEPRIGQARQGALAEEAIICRRAASRRPAMGVSPLVRGYLSILGAGGGGADE